MSKQIDGFITWIRTFLDDIYAPKGSGGSDLDIDFVPKSENENGVICFSGGLTYDLDKVYPVGSIYMSVNSTNPSTLFGGTWVQLTDTFLYASNTADTNSTTATGGEATHSLTLSEMPSHNHTQNAHHHIPNANWDFLLGQTGVNWESSGGKGSIAQSGNNHYAYTSSSNSDVGQLHNTSDATPTINNTGGGGAHNNMPPYMKVFMWKRTA